MEVLYPRYCGLDVHKSSITACVLLARAGKGLKHIRRFGSTTRELRELVAWLDAQTLAQLDRIDPELLCPVVLAQREMEKRRSASV